MAWTAPEHTKSQINKAGKDIFSEDPEVSESSRRALNNWRAAHNYPLNIFQMMLRRFARAEDQKALIAQRIKRLPSIILKLQRFPDMRMSAMQDLGGCRAVVSSVEKVYRVVEALRGSRINHVLASENDYIEKPKVSGYRGYHLIFRYLTRSPSKACFNDLKIEVQIRTSRQHAWATAVETVGTFLNQSLKSSSGHEEWLRFFALMSSFIAHVEGYPHVPGTPEDYESLSGELMYYIQKLEVESYLAAFGKAVEVIPQRQGHYFLLVLDPDARRINVQGFSKGHLADAEAMYGAVEADIKSTNKNAVLVSADSISSLRKAYPNYFLDVGEFLELVKSVKVKPTA